MLKKKGIFNLTASNLESSNLESGFKAKFVEKFLTINAEAIALESDSFNYYLLCKEALHHMPRPMIAIYEMLRAARKGVFSSSLKTKLLIGLFSGMRISIEKSLQLIWLEKSCNYE